MTDDKSDMDHSNGEQTVDPNSNSIPGGKQQKPLEEPESPEGLFLIYIYYCFEN